jgi:two-component system sensor histidine kinase KdpD
MLQPVREWCEPGEILREAISIAGVEQRTVQIDIEPNLPEILIDPSLIEQALVTLVSNAASYSSSKHPIEASAGRQDSTIVFSVADRGPGLAAGEETKVFEKFYRGAGRKAGGLGLGLSIAQKLVEVHGGKIVAQNRTGGGSLFSIRLPLGEPMKLPAEAAL